MTYLVTRRVDEEEVSLLVDWGDFSDDDAYQMVEALYQSRDSIPWDIDRPVELTDLCGGQTAATPLGIPRHSGAERFYREHGALK